MRGRDGAPGPLHRQRRDRCRWRDGTGPATLASQAERNTERSGVFLALETKFLLFWTGQKRDSVLSERPVTGFDASVFGSDSLGFKHTPGLDTGADLGSPDRLRVFRHRKYLGTLRRPRESPGNTRTGHLLARGPAPGRLQGGGPVWPGGGDYRRVVHGGSTRRQPTAISNATCFTPEVARLKQDDKTAID